MLPNIGKAKKEMLGFAPEQKLWYQIEESYMMVIIGVLLWIEGGLQGPTLKIDLYDMIRKSQLVPRYR